MPLTPAHLCVRVFKDVRNTGFLEAGIAGPGAESSSFPIEVSLNRKCQTLVSRSHPYMVLSVEKSSEFF